MVKRSAEKLGRHRKTGPNKAPAPTGLRMLDARVREQFGLSWGKARAAIEGGKVFADGELLTDPTTRIAEDRLLELKVNAPKPRGGRLDVQSIVHIDAQVVVVKKPAGLATIPFQDEEQDNLEQRLKDHLSARSSRGGIAPLGVVHRLDKETTGLVVFTRTWLAKQSLSSQFRDHSVHRVYFAIVHGAVQSQTFRSYLVENRGDGLRGSSKHRNMGGQLAVTHVEFVRALKGATLVRCQLETGRTHQIRIHLAEAGHPLIGERVYIRGYSGDEITAKRLMLHAAELGFVHPATQEPVRFTEDLPADMTSMLSRLAKTP